jgi:hypothetical protein
MKKLVIILGVWIAIFFIARVWWDHYTSPVSMAERITGLDLPVDATPVTFMNDYSILLSSGITCGEIAIKPRDIVPLLEQARQEDYLSTLKSGKDNLLGVVHQPACCQDSSVRFEKHPGLYKELRRTKEETAYVVIDSLRRKLYFFRSIPNAIW